MRPSIAIAACLLALASFAAPPACAAASPARAWTVSGYGPTQNDAQEDAFREAEQRVNAYLDSEYPGLGWRPDAIYLQGIDAVRFATVKQDPSLFGGHGGYTVEARVDLTEPVLRKMQDKVDEERAKTLEPVVSWRHLLIARILAAFVALFLVIAGYIRLEEMTRGYYTTLLRLTAAAVLGLTVAVLFVTF